MLSVFRLPALVLAKDLSSVSMTIFKLCCFKEALLLAAVSHVPTLNCERTSEKLMDFVVLSRISPRTGMKAHV